MIWDLLSAVGLPMVVVFFVGLRYNVSSWRGFVAGVSFLLGAWGLGSSLLGCQLWSIALENEVLADKKYFYAVTRYAFGAFSRSPVSCLRLFDNRAFIEAQRRSALPRLVW